MRKYLCILSVLIAFTLSISFAAKAQTVYVCGTPGTVINTSVNTLVKQNCSNIFTTPAASSSTTDLLLINYQYVTKGTTADTTKSLAYITGSLTGGAGSYVVISDTFNMYSMNGGKPPTLDSSFTHTFKIGIPGSKMKYFSVWTYPKTNTGKTNGGAISSYLTFPNR